MFFAKTSSILTGSQVAMWTMGAIAAMVSFWKLVEWILSITGLLKSGEEKLKASLLLDLARLQEIHAIITDKVHKKVQEDSHEQLETLCADLSRVLPWLAVPPAVNTPKFWCKTEDQKETLTTLLEGINALLKAEGERAKQTEIIVQLLELLNRKKE